MSIFKKIGAWIAKAFQSVKTDGANIAVAITEGLQQALKSGVVTFVADLVTAIFPQVHDIPQEVVAELQTLVPKVLAAELAVQGLPDNPTGDDILAFEKRILDAFNVHDQKSKLYTTLAAQIYGLLQKYVGDDNKLTFAEIVALVEEAYLDYKADVEAAA